LTGICEESVGSFAGDFQCPGEGEKRCDHLWGKVEGERKGTSSPLQMRDQTVRVEVEKKERV
jgi:hypothetical protein